MPTDLVIENLSREKGINKGIFRLLILSAAVLKNCKQSNMIFVSLEELKLLILELANTNLKLALLYQDNSKYLILIYRENSLNEYLRQEEIRNFLYTCGYEGTCFKHFLPYLRERIARARNLGQDFPHEIGAFLGYPLCDIEGFLRCQGKNYLHSGYWKVYANLDTTMAKFKQIDEARNQAIYEWFEGRSFYEIAY